MNDNDLHIAWFDAMNEIANTLEESVQMVKYVRDVECAHTRMNGMMDLMVMADSIKSSMRCAKRMAGSLQCLQMHKENGTEPSNISFARGQEYYKRIQAIRRISIDVTPRVNKRDGTLTDSMMQHVANKGVLERTHKERHQVQTIAYADID